MKKLMTLFFILYSIGAMAQCEITSFGNQYGFNITKQITNPGEYQNKIIKWAITDFTGLDDIEYINEKLIIFRVSDIVLIETLPYQLISYLIFEIKDNELITTYIPKYIDLGKLNRNIYEYEQFCLFSDEIRKKYNYKSKYETIVKKQGSTVILQINKIISQYEEMIKKSSL